MQSIGFEHRRQRVAALGAVLVIAACGPSRTTRPTPVPVTPPPAPTDTATPAEAPAPVAGIAFAYKPGAYRYEIVAESEIRQPDDSLGTAARVRTRTIATLLIAPLGADSLHVDLTIDSVEAERDSLIPPPDSADTLASTPHRFTGVMDARGLHLASSPAPSAPSSQPTRCSGEEGLLGVVGDLLFIVPDQLPTGIRWSDTSTVALCRGGVPVTTGVVRDYEVTGSHQDADGTPLLRIARRTSFSLAGTQTTSYGQVVALTGSGQSESTLDLDPGAGVVRTVAREGTSDVLVTYGRTSTPFVQKVTQRVTLKPQGARN